MDPYVSTDNCYAIAHTRHNRGNQKVTNNLVHPESSQMRELLKMKTLRHEAPSKLHKKLIRRNDLADAARQIELSVPSKSQPILGWAAKSIEVIGSLRECQQIAKTTFQFKDIRT